MTGKGSLMTLRGTVVNGTKLKVPEAEDAAGFGNDSPAKKMKASRTKSLLADGADEFETAWSGTDDAVRDINLLFSKYSEVLRERAAVDASQIQELTDILTEAMNLESQLKEKKEHLRQALAIISDKLQG
ncbi:testis-expressed protein 12 isoform X1 [Tachysurus fulvidraco]|uniref:testis-expressed protein 12 isoform X1 n=1 Tax=Tachysurus fulvidraco TaxID=1234273 RepID=UPI000F4F7A9F|nr:testis-expressed protein 12 isoform X1 [Tachysurus fulvidraco]XP_027029764.1 testis-expressed protein 12 isoform X1 [Tachysurus fulvidraco]